MKHTVFSPIFLLFLLLPCVSSFEANYDLKGLYCEKEGMSFGGCLKYWASMDNLSLMCPSCNCSLLAVNPLDYYPEGYHPDCEKTLDWKRQQNNFELEKLRIEKGFSSLDCPSCPACDSAVGLSESDCKQQVSDAVAQESKKCKEQNAYPWYFPWIAGFLVFLLVCVLLYFAYRYFIRRKISDVPLPPVPGHLIPPVQKDGVIDGTKSS